MVSDWRTSKINKLWRFLSLLTKLGVPLYGGFDVFGKGAEMKITVDLKPHYKIKVKTVFMKIDSWDNEVGIFRIDNNEVWKRAF